MRRLFLSPHDDDQTLFGAFTCLRHHPDVLVVLDSYIQPNRGEIGCDAPTRAGETLAANRILGCETIRLNLRDDIATQEEIQEELTVYRDQYDIVYAPAYQSGNIHHDMVNLSAYRVFGNKVIEYTTYTKTELWTKGNVEIVPTEEELRLKNEALDCYKSQISINLPHFQAVYGKSEWLNRTKLSKVFILTQFGEPHSWTQEYIDHVQHLEKYGWYWKIFTPNPLKSKGNVEVIPMTTDQFNDLVFSKLHVRPNLFMTERGVPSVHMTDFCVAWGVIFEDYLKGYDYWGIPNWDIVYGRLDRFLPDSELEKYDVWTDDSKAFNGIFSLMKNIQPVNDLFMRIENWRAKFGQPPCPRCVDGIGSHVLFGTDEYDMTEVLKRQSLIRYGQPLNYPIHSHDRLENHVPDVKLEMKKDGTLMELLTDVAPPNWIHAYPHFGREIPYFHFMRTKKWPL